MRKGKLVYPYRLEIEGKTFDDSWIFAKHPMENDNRIKEDWFAAINYKEKMYYLFVPINGNHKYEVVRGKEFTKIFGTEYFI